MYTVFSALVLALLAASSHAASITASVSRNPVTLDESFSLILQADGEVDAQPDLSPLKKDFDILGTSQSTSMNFVNGNFSRKSTWTIDLMSKAVGVLSIPSIEFGKDRSPSLRITVKDSQHGSQAMADAPIQIEVSTDRQQVWQQAQLVLTIKLLHKGGISNASLSEVKTSDPYAIIEQLGEDSNYEIVRNGVRYGVIERKYAIFPQTSGKLTIEPLRFEARVGNIRRDFFGNFGGGSLKRVRSRPIEIDVKPAPASIKSDQWLPAEKVLIKQQWSQPLDKLHAGEPVTRTITLVARGMLASQLPDIALPEVDGIRLYPDKPVLNSKTDGNDVVASKQIKIAMIPGYGGRYTLPEVRVPWWNTQTGEMETATLPAQTLVVSGETRNPNDTRATPDSRGENSAAGDGRAEQTPQPLAHSAQNTDSLWKLTSLLLALGWTLTLVAIFWLRRNGALTPTPGKTLSPRKLRQQAIARCRQNDASGCRDALLQWAQAQWPQQRISNLIDIAARVDDTTGNAIRALNASLYGTHTEQWRGEALARALQQLSLGKNARRTAPGPVAPLHKIR